MSSTAVSNIDNKSVGYIRMISEGSCTEDWSNDAENSAAHHPWTTTPIIHCTYDTHFPIHHCTNHTAVTNHSLTLIVSPHLQLIHTHTDKQHTSLHSPRSLVLAPADISERYPSCCLLSLCLTPDCPTLELWTCDPDFCLVLFMSLPCLWYSCFCPLTFACLILPLSNKYLTANGSTRLWPVITVSQVPINKYEQHSCFQHW